MLSQEVFESLSDYVITGKQLCGRTVTVNANNTHLMGVPLCIEHEKVRDTTNLGTARKMSTHSWWCSHVPVP